MTTTRAGHPLERPDDARDLREHLRTVAPVLVSVLLLFGVAIAAFLALGELLNFGVWLV
ncbi:MAG: hypothetical protein H5T80_11615, partial [Dietzia sp.]|nr:hypothetical protein [Dietzia sp.]